VSICSHLAAVNQKLLFAKKLVAITDQSAFDKADKHFLTAIAQSVTLQLYQAWCWHLQDVASNYKLQDPSAVKTAQDLAQYLAQEGKTPTEAAELVYLASTDNSWVSDLLNAYQQLFIVPQVHKAQMDMDRLPLLSIDDVCSSKIIEWDIAKVTDWTENMTELVERQREMMIEF
jgi:hypothetical protein